MLDGICSDIFGFIFALVIPCMRMKNTNTTWLAFFFIILGHFSQKTLAMDLRGYTQDIEQEKSEHFAEVKLWQGATTKQVDLQEAIFNTKLSKEFKEKYREKFGNIDTESILYKTSRFETLDENTGFDSKVEAHYADRRTFAEYMLKRLSEYHFDNYFKSEPALRPAYEMKEKLSNIEVRVNQEVKLDFNYSFAGNTLDLIANNPWIESKFIFEMDPHSFGPGPTQEVKLFLSKKLESQKTIASTTLLDDGISIIELLRPHKYNLASSIGYSNYFKSTGKSPREQRLLFGLTHTY